MTTICAGRCFGLALLAIAIAAQCAPGNAADRFDPSPRAIEVPAWFKPSFLDFRDDIAEAQKSGRRLMAYFGQDGCPYCRELMRVNFSQKDIAEAARTHFDAVALNIWGDREVTWLDRRLYTEKTFAAFMKVQFTPTLLFFDERGNVVLRLNGYYPPHQFAAALQYVAGRHETRTTFAQFLAQSAPEPGSGKLHAEPFFLGPPFDLARLTRGGKPIAVLFEQKDCRACDELHRAGFRSKPVKTAIGRFSVVRLELFGTAPLKAPGGRTLTEADWAAELGVAYTPTFVFFDAAGGEVFRMEGYLRPFHVASGLEYVATGAYRKEPSFQRYVQARAARIRAAGGRVDLW